MYILSSDYDGTLFINSEISIADKIAIERFRKNGNLFIINTGRSLEDIYNQFKINGLEADYYVGSNGSMIANNNREIIYKADFSLDLAKEIVDYFKKNLRDRVFFIGVDDSYNTGVEFFEKDFKFFKDGIVSVDEVLNDDITTLFSQIRDNEDINIILDQLNSHFNNRAIFKNTYPYIDINEKLNTKATALEIIKEIEGEKILNIFAIGDELNDLSMLSAFDGYAMEHSKDYIKSEIKKTILSVNHLIEKILAM